MVSRAGEILAAGTEGWWNGPGIQWCCLQIGSWGWPWGSTSLLLLEESSSKASAVVERALADLNVQPTLEGYTPSQLQR